VINQLGNVDTILKSENEHFLIFLVSLQAGSWKSSLLFRSIWYAVL